MSHKPTNFTPLTTDELSALKAQYPEVPPDYMEFLLSPGYGELTGGIMIYSGLVPPESVFGPRSVTLPEGIHLFGDDFAGTSFGFDSTNGWTVIAIDSTAMEVLQEASSF